MSILIKGIDMPQEGNWKTVRIFPNGECAVPNWQGDCTFIQGAQAVPVPPHSMGEKVLKPVCGDWIWDDEGYHCPECWYHAYDNSLEVLTHWKFCPVCGARLKCREIEE